MISKRLCRSEVNYNTRISEELANVKAMNRVIRLGMPVQQQINKDCKEDWDKCVIGLI
ncbi:hypothetical protein BTN49_3167 [Candidatus Enterovibrio escicola]|uniref:Mobile element protein n=1 Tax=Candidatus Enterovibrio escicola TaxID=1927127 RepID=A0A2A5SZC7_9GAMM|nr:hypothetical protein [Candidatus Enterovibrio escacola]PCS21279.1 hypothetical protein BTN49_3167 [Candidatus Enterovibrio escacola]